MKYSFVIPYIDRLKQFEVTLNSYKLWYDLRDDWEVVIVCDAKGDREDIREAIALAKRIVGAHRVVTGAYPYRNAGNNPVVLYNYGFLISQGEFIVTTNPECYHETDVLRAFDALCTQDIYMVASCKFELTKEKWIWRQHGKHCPTFLHFCSCIPRRLLQKFDEDFKDGYCFDDDALRDAYMLSGVPVVSLSAAVVVHQLHRKEKGNPALWQKNKAIWKEKYADKLGIDADRYTREMMLPPQRSEEVTPGYYQYKRG